MPRARTVDRPTLAETAAVLAAVDAYLHSLLGVGGDVADLPVHLEQLKASIAKVEAVTTTDGR